MTKKVIRKRNSLYKTVLFLLGEKKKTCIRSLAKFQPVLFKGEIHRMFPAAGLAVFETACRT